MKKLANVFTIMALTTLIISSTACAKTKSADDKNPTETTADIEEILNTTETQIDTSNIPKILSDFIEITNTYPFSATYITTDQINESYTKSTIQILSDEKICIETTDLKTSPEKTISRTIINGDIYAIDDENKTINQFTGATTDDIDRYNIFNLGNDFIAESYEKEFDNDNYTVVTIINDNSISEMYFDKDDNLKYIISPDMKIEILEINNDPIYRSTFNIPYDYEITMCELYNQY